MLHIKFRIRINNEKAIDKILKCNYNSTKMYGE